MGLVKANFPWTKGEGATNPRSAEINNEERNGKTAMEDISKDDAIDSLEYREYDPSYEKEAIDIFTKAFESYPLFEIVRDDFKTRERYLRFYRGFMKALFKATIRKNACFLGVSGDRVIDLLIVEAPTDRPVGFMDYVLSGGIIPIVRLGLINALRYLSLSEETEKVVKAIEGPRWHLYLLAVDPSCQGKGAGSDAIRNFLLPFVRERKGKLITVTTNAKRNCGFYAGNGFSLLKEETLLYKGKSVTNWSFRMDL